MGFNASQRHEALTLADYRRLEAQGAITRPLTDRPIKMRRSTDAAAAPQHATKGDDTPKVRRT